MIIIPLYGQVESAGIFLVVAGPICACLLDLEGAGFFCAFVATTLLIETGLPGLLPFALVAGGLE